MELAEDVSMEKIIILSQDKDCCDGETPIDECQHLTIRSQNGAVDWRDSFLVIETDRWSIDPEDIDIFCQMLKDFMKDFDKKPVDKRKK